MWFYIKKIIFKFMELGLGLKTCFTLETRNPIFLNFKLSDEEIQRVAESLPTGFELQRIKFLETDPAPEYWISYNLYEIVYPNQRLKSVRKVRGEINTFVTDPSGRKGILVFCGSPYVSRDEHNGILGQICDFAERLVMFIYGCGKLIPLTYDPHGSSFAVNFSDGDNKLSLDVRNLKLSPGHRLSTDYYTYNDLSFFNHGKTFDRVSSGSAFYRAEFMAGTEPIPGFNVASKFFNRCPDTICYHEGAVTYSVDALNRTV